MARFSTCGYNNRGRQNPDRDRLSRWLTPLACRKATAHWRARVPGHLWPGATRAVQTIFADYRKIVKNRRPVSRLVLNPRLPAEPAGPSEAKSRKPCLG